MGLEEGNYEGLRDYSNAFKPMINKTVLYLKPNNTLVLPLPASGR